MTQRKKVLSSIFCVIMLTFVMAACTNGKVLNQKQQATIWMETYNAQYDDTMAIMTNPASTEIQRAIGKKKKDILISVWPMLKIYTGIVNAEGTPTPEIVNDITEQMNLLTSLATGGK